MAALVAGGCGKSGGGSSAPTTLAPTVPPTTATTVPPSYLIVNGYSPGVEQAPFYPTTQVSLVTCGAAPTGRFVAFTVPAGGSGTAARSVLLQPSTVVVVPGKAVVKDHTGKRIYEEDMASITTDHNGSFVLSMVNVASTGGDGGVVNVGALDVSGDYTCPATDVPFPGT